MRLISRRPRRKVKGIPCLRIPDQQTVCNSCKDCEQIARLASADCLKKEPISEAIVLAEHAVPTASRLRRAEFSIWEPRRDYSGKHSLEPDVGAAWLHIRLCQCTAAVVFVTPLCSIVYWLASHFSPSERFDRAAEINHIAYTGRLSYSTIAWMPAYYTNGVDAPKAWFGRRNVPDYILVPMRPIAYVRQPSVVPFLLQ